MKRSVVPRALLGAVDGVGMVAVGALQLGRDVLVSAVSGAANIGAEALRATVAGARGLVSATSQTFWDIAGAAQGTLLATIDSVRRTTASMNNDGVTSVTSSGQPPTPKRTRGPRRVTRPARPTGVAA